MEDCQGSASLSKVECRKNEVVGDRLEPLKVNSASCKIKKTPASLPVVVQHRKPLIIHTFSPKVILTDPRNFMWMVQKLTGSADTRSRCKKNKPQPPTTMESATISSNIADMPEMEMLITKASHESHDQESSSEPLSKAVSELREIDWDDISPRGPLPAIDVLCSISGEDNLANVPAPSNFNFGDQNPSEVDEPLTVPLLEISQFLADEP